MHYRPWDRLHAGTLVQRYKRFLADVERPGGDVVTAHCANSGSMAGMRAPGSAVLLSHQPDPRRKLPWTWELVRPPHASAWIGCNTARPNHIVEAALRGGALPGIGADAPVRREVPYGRQSRVDMVAGSEDDACHIEVKNATLAAPPGWGDEDRSSLDAPPLESGGNTALFPDAVTTRGARHMDELAAVVQGGGRGMVVFLVNRADCDRFAVARVIDGAYAAAFDRARDAGVEMVALGVEAGPDGWRLRGPLPVDCA